MRLLIASGTGTSGTVVARRAAAAGHHPRILTRGASQLSLDGPLLGPARRATPAHYDPIGWF